MLALLVVSPGGVVVESLSAAEAASIRTALDVDHVPVRLQFPLPGEAPPTVGTEVRTLVIRSVNPRRERGSFPRFHVLKKKREVFFFLDVGGQPNLRMCSFILIWEDIILPQTSHGYAFTWKTSSKLR